MKKAKAILALLCCLTLPLTGCGNQQAEQELTKITLGEVTHSILSGSTSSTSKISQVFCSHTSKTILLQHNVTKEVISMYTTIYDQLTPGHPVHLHEEEKTHQEQQQHQQLLAQAAAQYLAAVQQAQQKQS